MLSEKQLADLESYKALMYKCMGVVEYLIDKSKEAAESKEPMDKGGPDSPAEASIPP